LDDHLLGITHIIRGIDLKKEGDIEHFIWNIYGWEEPNITLYGRLDFGDEFKLSKTFQRQQIQAGNFDGWSDPRTWSLQSLEMRGIRPEALREALLELGLSNRNITFDKSWVYAKNKHLIDPIENRYWFVENARKLVVSNIPFSELIATPLVNPSNSDTETREVPISIEDGVCEFYIAEDDLKDVLNAKGKIIHPAIKVDDVIRIKDMFNITITDLGDPIQAEFESKEKAEDSRKIQAVPVKDNIPVKVLQPNGNITHGFGEANLARLEPKTIVQFERYGYVRIINITSEEVYCYFINE
jgi:glutamyl-tRNA synthetase